MQVHNFHKSLKEKEAQPAQGDGSEAARPPPAPHKKGKATNSGCAELRSIVKSFQEHSLKLEFRVEIQTDTPSSGLHP